MNEIDSLCGENVFRDGSVAKENRLLPRALSTCREDAPRGDSPLAGRVGCERGLRHPRGPWRRGGVPGPPSRRCPHISCPHDPRSVRVALSGCFWPQGAVAQGWADSWLAGSLQGRQLSRAPPRLSIPLSCHCFPQRHMGSTRNNTTVWVQPFKITELFFFLRSPRCSHRWRPDLHVFAAPVFHTSPRCPVSVQLELRCS